MMILGLYFFVAAALFFAGYNIGHIRGYREGSAYVLAGLDKMFEKVGIR